jgi:hypothetical protein
LIKAPVGRDVAEDEVNGNSAGVFHNCGVVPNIIIRHYKAGCKMSLYLYMG